ncbi:NADP-dependent oxidoreductase [Actinoplanes sp. NPDC023714]|uniref:NADP-dependent oxidoreductase n=1 Tax=Actinoplanes sp. NPDC023714 TaxID=3154322 RepID=UPI0033FFE8C1
MRAWRLHAYGEPELITTDEVDRPSPGPGEVLLRVAATSFNPSEVGLRRGLLRGVVEVDLPYVLGWDVAGTVVASGPGPHAGPFAAGDPVIGRLDGGAAADYAVAPASALVAAPASIPLAHAAALPIAGLTAWQAVFEHGRVTAGQRVLVNGAGAVGRLAIQLARHAGARVYAAASARSAEAAVRAGAGVERPPPGSIDVALHFVPGPVGDLTTLLRPGGVLVSATVPVDVSDESPAGLVKGVHFVARDDPAQLSELVKLVDAGEVRVEVAAVRPLTELARVHAEAESGALPAGKTIVVP